MPGPATSSRMLAPSVLRLVRLRCLKASGRVIIQGNKIGTNASGTAAMPNGDGIYIDGCNGFLIGGTAPGAGNLISGNRLNAIDIARTTGGTIEGNDIGTDITGTLAIPNGTIKLSGDAAAVVLGNGASDVTIGGTTAAARNVISGNNGDGIQISGGLSLRTVANRPSTMA